MDFSKRAWTFTLMLTFVVGVWSWQRQPEWPSVKAIEVAEEAWSLSRPPVPDIGKPLDFMANSTMWGNVEIVKGPEEEHEPAWRFLGIMASGSEKYVMIWIDKQPDRQLRIGDQLPGGAKILDIRPDALCIQLDDKKRLLPIYPQARQVL